ncbi:MAG: succinate dehydrogenase cytochrome b subunit [Desulfopila sp.]
MWFINFLKSSIGKKYIMATSGLLLVLFLCTHIFGNAAIYIGSHAFQGYADALHSLPMLVFLFSLCLFIVFVAHIFIGILLFLENRKVHASRYAVTNHIVNEKNSVAARTMPYSGLFVLLFLLIHVSSFTFGPEGIPISEYVKQYFNGFFTSAFYLLAFAALALHLSHGFWSMLQTFGINHPRFNTLIGKLTYIVPVFFLIVFAGIPLYFLTGLGANY